MASQLMMVPVILKNGQYTASDLEPLGSVRKTDEGWVIEYVARVRYWGDDETFMFDFWHATAALDVDIDDGDLVRFEWGSAEKIRTPLPG